MDSQFPFPNPKPPSEGEELALLVAELRLSLTLIMARSQMLRRRIDTGKVADVEACIPTLAGISGSVFAMEERLRMIEAHLATLQPESPKSRRP